MYKLESSETRLKTGDLEGVDNDTNNLWTPGISAPRHVPDRARLTGRFQKTATTKRKTIDEYKIADWSSLGAGASIGKGEATGGRLLIIAGGRMEAETR